MEQKKRYAKRVTLTEEQQKIILDHYKQMTAREILPLLQATDPTKPFNDQTIYGFLRRVRREAEKSINVLIEHNAQEAAEKLKKNIDTLIPDKRHQTADAISSFLNTLISES